MTLPDLPDPAADSTPARRRWAPFANASFTRVMHQGGPRDGQVADLPTAVLAGYLVYDGPRWFGVYGPADPPCTVPTPAGPAELWVTLDG